MKDDIILKIESLSKQYRLGTVGTGTLSHDINRAWAKLRGKEDPYLKIGAVNDRSSTASSDYVWALKDINFEVKRGEIVGIIGKNGAGKSTLLKILSRVTSPTTGSIKVGGRMASLLEVGTGMHPELTGRENIYLNGAILGMTKAEISSKIDEIIDFSGCQMYIDTPVKRYSSGMGVRLGFAVAAFLEPDILVVDEVLAVGDAEFQKKAIGKMQDISSSGGRTVLFVSHNMASIKSLCSRTIVLKNGTVSFDGNTVLGIQAYLKESAKVESKDLLHLTERSGTGLVKFQKFWIANQVSNTVNSILSGDEVEFCFHLFITPGVDRKKIDLGFSIHDNNMDSLAVLYSSYQRVKILANDKAKIEMRCKIRDFPFNEGVYYVKGRILYDSVESDWVKLPLGKLAVVKGDFYETGNLGFNGNTKFLVKGVWSQS